MGAFKEFYLNESEVSKAAKLWGMKHIGFNHYKDRNGLVWTWNKEFKKFERNKEFENDSHDLNWKDFDNKYGRIPINKLPKISRNESLEKSEKMYWMVIDRKGKYPYTKVYDNLKPMTHKECMTFKSKQTNPSDWTIKEIE
jgi:hypothetical protein